MTKIKLCGIMNELAVNAANELRPDYVGFVFAPKSKRRITPEQASVLKRILHPEIMTVGVFTDETPEQIASLANEGIIDLIQLHGHENADYITSLRLLTHKPVIQAFRIICSQDILDAEKSPADHVLLDSGAGTGILFDWSLIHEIQRPYFLAGGLDAHNVGPAIKALHPYAVDVSSGIETDGVKDIHKMARFISAVSKEDQNDKP